MTAPELLVDLALCAGLLGLAKRMLATTDLFEAVVLFIVFGLLLALAWARLSAPNTALAEAAFGAGLAGAPLLATLAHLGQKRAVGPDGYHDDE